MRRCDSFAGRLTVLCMSNLSLQALGFVYRIFLSRLAGAEGLGVYRLAFSAYIVLHAACLSGVTMACTRMAAAWSAQGRLGAVRLLVRRAFSAFLGIFSVGSTVLLLLRDPIARHILGDSRTAAAIPVMLACIALTGIENVCKSTMVGLGRVDNAAASELIEQLVRIAVTLALLYGARTGDLGWVAVLIFAGMTVSECVSAVVMVCLYRRLRLPPVCRPPAGAWAEFRAIVLPVSLSALLSNGVASAGAVVLPMRLAASGLTQTEAVAALGVVSGVASPIMLLPIALLSSLCTVAMPEISRYAAVRRTPALRRFTGRTVFAAGVVGIPATALLLPLAPAIARLFFYRAVPPRAFWLIGLSCILCYYQMVTSCLLTGLGRQQQAVLSALGGELVQLALTWLLAGHPALRVYGYLLAQCIAPLAVTLYNTACLLACGALPAAPAQLVGIPLVCGAVIFLWTRIFYYAFTGWLGGQWLGLICAAGSAIVLYLCVLRLFGVRVERYLRFPSHTPAYLHLFY